MSIKDATVVLSIVAATAFTILAVLRLIDGDSGGCESALTLAGVMVILGRQ